MNNIKFHIFGVPDGFDIYQEIKDVETKNYYQCFYDESIKEQTRLAINRKPNGDVSYTFLKYHLYSKLDRPNAFLGLSVVFSNGYYADVSSLYNLLEQTYNSILQKGKLLNPIDDGSSVKFAVNKFSEAQSEIKRIESIVLGTLYTEEYIAEYLPFDSSFVTGKQNAILKVPFQIYDTEVLEREANLLVIEKLKKFSWLSLSPDYIKKEKPVLPGEMPSIKNIELDEELDPVTKAQYINSFENYQSQVLTAFEKLVSKTDENLNGTVKQLDAIVKGILISLREYVKKQNELKELLDKYSGLAEKLDTLSDKLYELSKKQNLHNKFDESQHKQVDTEDGNKNGERKGGMWQRYLAVAGGAIAVVCIFVFFCKPYLFPDDSPVNDLTGSDVVTTAKGDSKDDSTSKQDDSTGINLEGLLAKFNEALQSNDFETAIAYYSRVLSKDESYRKVREMDNSLDVKFEKLIEDCSFDLANNLYLKLTTIYDNADSYSAKLKRSFKDHIQTNKSIIQKKNDLIKHIQQAKAGGYDYAGLEADLADIKKLGTVSTPENGDELSLYCDDNKTTSQKKASDIIEIEAGKLYTITNPHWEQNGSFGFDAKISGIELVPNGNGQNAVIKIRANKSAIGKSINIHYKKSGNIKFTFQIKIIESSEMDGAGMKVNLKK